jgi:hypothetical protein
MYIIHQVVEENCKNKKMNTVGGSWKDAVVWKQGTY